jgi:hypothetical protein
MVYWTYDSFNMFRALSCPSSGAWDYTDVYSLWHITFVIAGRGSGACVASCSHAPDLSAIPYVGKEIVQWVWGGFAVDATLTRFFALYFLIQFVITAIVIIHLLFLHQTGSNNPVGLNKNTGKIPFHPYITVKDILFCCVASCSHTRPTISCNKGYVPQAVNICVVSSSWWWA